MKNIYSIEDAINEMTRKVNYYGNRLAAWNTVKRVSKKGGGDFAYAERNFTTENAASGNGLFLETGNTRLSFRREYGLYKAVITFYGKNEGYTSDTIYLPDDAGVNEIENEIEKHKEKLRDWMTKAEKGREEIAANLEKARPHIDALRAIIGMAIETESNFTIRDYIVNNINR